MSHTGAADAPLSVSERTKNSHLNCRTNLPHKRVAHGRKHRSTGIWLRGAVWQYRVRVPSSIVQAFGKGWVSVSLKTSDYRVAVQRARRAAFEIETSFDAVRHGREAIVSPSLDYTVASSGSLHSAPDIRITGDMCTAGTLRSENRTTLPSPRSDSLEAVVAKPTNPTITIRQLYERYLDDPGVVRSAKTRLAYETVYRRLMDLIDPGTLVQDIQREDCRALLQTLRKLPANATKLYGRVPAHQAIRIAQEKQRQPMSVATTNSYMNKLSGLLNWAVNEGYIQRNPARGLKVADPVRKRDKRTPFSTEQLNTIFNAPIYRGCVDDDAGYRLPGKMQPRRSRFWVPLIALFSGMRLNEICQLNTEDVREVHDIPSFVVTTSTIKGANDKRLKTKNAERIIPIHPTLLHIGLMAYVQTRLEGRGSKLFPDIEISVTGYYSDNFSKWFGHFLSHAGAKAPRTSFHSFRHCFRDGLREAQIPREIAYAIGGWSSDSPGEAAETAENYGRGYRPATLLEAVAKVRYPDLNLAHLMART